MKFDKEKWNEKDDIFYAYREKMVSNLMTNHLKKGMTYNEVLSLLGNSENIQNETPNAVAYEIPIARNCIPCNQNKKNPSFLRIFFISTS